MVINKARKGMIMELTKLANINAPDEARSAGSRQVGNDEPNPHEEQSEPIHLKKKSRRIMS